MTTNGTRLHGADTIRGAHRVGQFADLIATPDNPLTSIQTLRQMKFVMRNAKEVKR